MRTVDVVEAAACQPPERHAQTDGWRYAARAAARRLFGVALERRRDRVEQQLERVEVEPVRALELVRGEARDVLVPVEPLAEAATLLLHVGVTPRTARPTHASSEGNDHPLRKGSVVLRRATEAAARRLHHGGDHDSGGPPAAATARQLRIGGGPEVRCGGDKPPRQTAMSARSVCLTLKKI